MEYFTNELKGIIHVTWDRHRTHSFSYDVVASGYNYRLDEMRAALGMVQLSRLPAGNARRRELTALYRQKIGELPQMQLPFLSARLEASARHLFSMLTPADVDRAQFMSHLAEHGIQTSIHYPPIHKFSYYRQLWPAGYNHQLPHTEEVAAREVTLPLYTAMTGHHLDEVAGVIRDFFARDRLAL